MLFATLCARGEKRGWLIVVVCRIEINKKAIPCGIAFLTFAENVIAGVLFEVPQYIPCRPFDVILKIGGGTGHTPGSGIYVKHVLLVLVILIKHLAYTP